MMKVLNDCAYLWSLIFIIITFLPKNSISQSIYHLDDLLNKNKAVVYLGIKSGDLGGWSVNGSKDNDIDGDGNADVLIGARFASPKNRTMAGQVFALFGSSIQNTDLQNLDDLRLGFTIDGKTATFNGYSVSTAGDVDGDGFSDIVIGARDGRPLNRAFSGEAYLLFGSNFIGGREPIEASDIKSPRGVTFFGAKDGDFIGNAVSEAGDFNNDGYDDFLIAALEAKNDDEISKVGKTYLFLGNTNWKNIDNLDLLNINNSSVIEFTGDEFGDLSGYAVAGGGDVNGDGFDDIIITAIGAKKSKNNNLPLGKVYVIFGRKNNPHSEVHLTDNYFDGINGFMIEGINEAGNFGFSASILEDINNDGFEDLIISEIGSAAVDGEDAPPYGEGIGKAYVILGSPTYPEKFDLSLLNGENGFIINGKNEGYFTGWSVSSAGDANKDGYNDILLSAPGADPNGISNAGEVYIIFGKKEFDQTFNLSEMNDNEGITIQGYESESFFGWSVSDTGDLNKDGYDDILIGSPFANPNNNKNAGKIYSVFINKSDNQNSDEELTENEKDIVTLYPNPVNSDNVNIRFSLTEKSDISVEMYDILGRKVLNSFNLNNAGPGELHKIISGNLLSSGSYIVKISINNENFIRKISITR